MRQSNKKKENKKKGILRLEHFPVLVLSLLHEKEPFFLLS